jgi:hypothetical protein
MYFEIWSDTYVLNLGLHSRYTYIPDTAFRQQELNRHALNFQIALGLGQ